MFYGNLQCIQIADIAESIVYLGSEIHTSGSSEPEVRYRLELDKPVSISSREESGAPAFPSPPKFKLYLISAVKPDHSDLSNCNFTGAAKKHTPSVQSAFLFLVLMCLCRFTVLNYRTAITDLVSFFSRGPGSQFTLKKK